MASPESVIDAIDTKLANGTVDKNTWNIYAREYDALNKALNATAEEIVQRFGGDAIPPVTGTHVEKVEDYYGKTISHRVVAEHAGDPQRSKTGPIGLQMHDPFSIIMFRNVRIREAGR